MYVNRNYFEHLQYLVILEVIDNYSGTSFFLTFSKASVFWKKKESETRECRYLWKILLLFKCEILDQIQRYFGKFPIKLRDWTL